MTTRSSKNVNAFGIADRGMRFAGGGVAEHGKILFKEVTSDQPSLTPAWQTGLYRKGVGEDEG